MNRSAGGRRAGPPPWRGSCGQAASTEDRASGGAGCCRTGGGPGAPRALRCHTGTPSPCTWPNGRRGRWTAPGSAPPGAAVWPVHLPRRRLPGTLCYPGEDFSTSSSPAADPSRAGEERSSAPGSGRVRRCSGQGACLAGAVAVAMAAAAVVHSGCSGGCRGGGGGGTRWVLERPCHQRGAKADCK